MVSLEILDPSEEGWDKAVHYLRIYSISIVVVINVTHADDTVLIADSEEGL